MKVRTAPRSKREHAEPTPLPWEKVTGWGGLLSFPNGVEDPSPAGRGGRTDRSLLPWEKVAEGRTRDLLSFPNGVEDPSPQPSPAGRGGRTDRSLLPWKKVAEGRMRVHGAVAAQRLPSPYGSSGFPARLSEARAGGTGRRSRARPFAFPVRRPLPRAAASVLEPYGVGVREFRWSRAGRSRRRPRGAGRSRRSGRRRCAASGRSAGAAGGSRGRASSSAPWPK